MNPVDTSKVDNLKARIKDGSYQASSSEMSGFMTDLLDGSSSSSGSPG